MNLARLLAESLAEPINAAGRAPSGNLIASPLRLSGHWSDSRMSCSPMNQAQALKIP
jgi:hypothetical protein